MAIISRPERVDDLKEGKAMEVRVSGVDLTNAVLSKEYRRVRVVGQVSAQVGKFGKRFRRHVRMTRSLDEDLKTRGG